MLLRCSYTRQKNQLFAIFSSEFSSLTSCSVFTGCGGHYISVRDEHELYNGSSHWTDKYSSAVLRWLFPPSFPFQHRIIWKYLPIKTQCFGAARFFSQVTQDLDFSGMPRWPLSSTRFAWLNIWPFQHLRIRSLVDDAYLCLHLQPLRPSFPRKLASMGAITHYCCWGEAGSYKNMEVGFITLWAWKINWKKYSKKCSMEICKKNTKKRLNIV